MLRGLGPGLETPVVTVIGEAPVVTVRGMLPTQSLEQALLLQCHGDGAQVADSDSDNLKRPSVADYGRQGPQKASVSELPSRASPSSLDGPSPSLRTSRRVASERDYTRRCEDLRAGIIVTPG